jgi:outer membrane receptor for ferrienterochelin and colicin
LKIIGKILVILVLLCFHLYAGTTGKIAGRVTDSQTGEPLTGANIMIEGTQFGSAADIEGDYYILNLAPGKYKLKISMVGYTTETIENVRVQVDLTTQINITLTSAAIDLGQTVAVYAHKEIQKDLTSSERSIQSDQIKNLPARDLTSILTMQAGITKDASGGIHIRGGRSSEVSYMVDGVQIMNPLDRSNGINIDDQAYEEVKAITGTFNAEYGQALSGVVNIVTKKGSDKFEANATVYSSGNYSTDDHYKIMTNREWANVVANSLVRQNGDNIVYDYLYNKYGLSRSQVNTMVANGDKPWIKTKNYLSVFRPLSNLDYQVNLSGPIPGTGKKLSYFVASRYQDGTGYSRGYRYFKPWGLWSPAYDTLHSFDMPDGKEVPLYEYDGYSGQGKIFYNDPHLQISYGLFVNDGHNYSAYSKYIPDGGQHNYNTQYVHILSSTIIFSNSTFLEVLGNYYDSHNKSYAYEDPHDYRYVPSGAGDFQQFIFNPAAGDGISVTTKPNDYTYFGNSTYRGDQKAKYFSAKLDLTSQINKYNLVKLGGSFRRHNLRDDYFDLQFSQVDYSTIIPSPSSAYHTQYSAQPVEAAAYIQDKIEFDELIINLGLRFDYFDSKGRILADPMDPEIYDPLLPGHKYKNYTPTTPESQLIEYTYAEKEKFWYKNAEAKYQLSPRFGLSFPITADGVIHFSYGHFFQNPSFSYLYANPNFWVTGAGATSLVGNANLNAERTTIYEIGLQQRLFSTLFLNVTGFYRDIRDWIGTGVPQLTYDGLTYYSYVNKDNAVAKGITLSAQYTIENLSVSLDYTYMNAMGTSSNATDAFSALMGGKQPLLQLINLSWDQPHTLNLIINYNYTGWIATLTGAFASGYPYTPSLYSSEATGSNSSYTGFIENSARIPSTLSFDLRLSRIFEVGFARVEAILNIQNLLDTRNSTGVYSDTGLSDYTKNTDLYSSRLVEFADTKEYYASPGNFTGPRSIQFGLRVGL